MRSNPAKIITDAHAATNRKEPSQSDFLSNLSTTSDNEYCVIGGFAPVPELPFEGGWIQIDKSADNALARRTNNVEYKLVIFMIGRTTSSARRPEYAEISMEDYRRRTGASERSIFYALATLEKKGFIRRNERGGVKVCPENFTNHALPSARTCRPRAKGASMRAAAPVAALLATAESEPADRLQLTAADAENQRCDEQTSVSESAVVQTVADARSLQLTAPNEGVQRYADSRSEMQLTAAADEDNFKPAATYCPWKWECPYLATPSELVSIKQLNSEEPTTTKRAAQSAAEQQNAYLARFLQPATRIGEQLQIDDDAAGRMWSESVARNPELTPREFVILVRMKLKEWNRESDIRPGRKIRSLIGLLLRSMPNAVVGALYLTAREAAPAELERDASDARAILAASESASRDRAWATAILREYAKT